MINDILSYCVDTIDVLFQIMQPLWVFIFFAALISVILEKLNLIRLLPESPLGGAVIGILSPLPTISAIPLIQKKHKGAAAFLAGSLLANPALLLLVYINLGIESVFIYTVLTFFIAVVFGQWAKFTPEAVLPKEREGVPPRHWLYLVWKYFAYLGFYTVLGGLASAILREAISWTLYNLQFLGTLSPWARRVFVLLAGPVYHCGGMWLPVLKELQTMGLGLGTVVGFILFGQATRLGHLFALQEILTKRSVIYLVLFITVISVWLDDILKYLVSVIR